MEVLEADEKLALRLADADTYFELAREGESIAPELRAELDTLRREVDRLETETLLGGENDHLNAIVAIHPGRVAVDEDQAVGNMEGCVYGILPTGRDIHPKTEISRHATDHLLIHPIISCPRTGRAKCVPMASPLYYYKQTTSASYYLRLPVW